MPRTLSMTVPDEVAEEFERLVAKAGLSVSEAFAQMVRAYRIQRRLDAFHELQRYGVKRARELRIKDEEDVYRLIQEFRQEERERRGE